MNAPMKKVKVRNSFAKDYKRHIKGTPLESEMRQLARLLGTGAPLPEKYKDHPLKGNLKGLRDCHLKPDMVVIYTRSDAMIELVRVGSHSELFG